EVQYHFGLAIAVLPEHVGDRPCIDRRPINGEAFAEVSEPAVILIELLPARQRPPGDKLVDVGVSGCVADVLALDARPSGRGNDLPRLRHQIAVANLLVLALFSQMRMVAAGRLSKRLPGLYRNLSVRLRREIENDLGGIDIAFDARATVGRPAVVDLVVQLGEAPHLFLGAPGEPIAAVAELIGDGTVGRGAARRCGAGAL